MARKKERVEGRTPRKGKRRAKVVNKVAAALPKKFMQQAKYAMLALAGATRALLEEIVRAEETQLRKRDQGRPQ